MGNGSKEIGFWDLPRALANNPKAADMIRSPEKVEYVLKNSGKLAGLAASVMRSKGDFLGASDMEEAGAALEDMADGIGKGATYLQNATAIYGIYDAWINIDPASVRKNPKESAKQFGRLFKHAGSLSETLPFPFSAYAGFLGGFENFFDDIREIGDPTSAKTPTGRMMHRTHPDLRHYKDIGSSAR